MYFGETGCFAYYINAIFNDVVYVLAATLIVLVAGYCECKCGNAKKIKDSFHCLIC